ncbi:MAG: hypothetical protein SPE24_08995 [Erysipelotrichaceae bacterium]|nr:hypothetical protein [Erysipelotrichaceae bacterium]
MSNNASNNSKKKNYYRPPQNKVVEQNSQHEETTKIINEFNSYRSSMAYSNYYFGLNVFDIYTPEQLASLVKDPMANNQVLRELSLILYGTNGVYTNTVDYLTAMPTLDRVIVPHGKSANKKKQNKELMESTLRSIKDKEIVRDALFRGMIEGVAFYYFETTSRPQSNNKMMTDYDVESIIEINELGINASIISLPVDYTRIVGIKNSSYVLAFNLDYFDIAEGESREKKLRKYPKEIRDAYTARKNNSAGNSGNWVILDNTKTIVHKIRSKREERYGRPLVLAAISDILYSDYFTQTKRNVLDEINNRIIYQTFPEGKDKGTSALTKQQQQSQHDAVKGAVMNKNNRGGISFFSVAAGTKINAIEASNTDIFDDKYESNLGDKIALDMGIASSLLNGSSSGSYSAQENNLEMLTSQLFQWIEQIQSELNKCISENIIKDYKNWVECKYLPITHVNKSKMVGYAKDLYLSGKGSLSLWASACGISPDIFFALLDQELEEDIENKYPVHITSYVASGKQDSGRPTTDEPTENTVASRSNNSNAMPSPSDK